MSMPTLTENKKKKSESQAITSVGKETEVSYVLLVGIWTGAVAVENSLVVPQKGKHRITIY